VNDAGVIDVTVAQSKPMTRKGFIALMVFVWAGLSFLLWPIAWKDYQHFKIYPKKKSYPVVTGQVIDRHKTPYHMGLRRPVLMIRPDGSDITVRALLIRNQLFDFPNGISFHYSGDPREEVLLAGESDARAAAFFWRQFLWWFRQFSSACFFTGNERRSSLWRDNPLRGIVGGRIEFAIFLAGSAVNPTRSRVYRSGVRGRVC
jgi:hypothetical protein